MSAALEWVRDFPKSYREFVNEADVLRVNRATLAVRLHKFPAEVDRQPSRDIWDLLGVIDDEAERAKG